MYTEKELNKSLQEHIIVSELKNATGEELIDIFRANWHELQHVHEALLIARNDYYEYQDEPTM